MSLNYQIIFTNIIVIILIKRLRCTIDLNAAELQYLADHLTREECRKLIAVVHLKNVEDAKIVEQAERTVSKDMPCIELLHHWNNAPGEGKGETHEVLERGLRKIGKESLADWLGKTVFREIGKDLNSSIEKGFEEFLIETTEEDIQAGPTLQPLVENSDPTEWSVMDTILYVIIVGLLFLSFGLCCKVCCSALWRWRRRKRNEDLKTAKNYSIIDETSGSESEDKFDIRHYSEKTNYSSSETET